MYLEISNGVDKPKLYRLERSTYFIGSQAGSDICISDPDISRKHMTLVIDSGRYYVIDRGSTNGTFLDDEKLEPGKKVEFPLFADVRLGSKILISLVPDEEVKEITGEITIPLNLDLSTSDNPEATRQISIAELKKAKTTELVRQKKKVKAKAKKKKKNYNSYLALGILVIGGFSYFKIEGNENVIHDEPVVEVVPSRKSKQEAMEASVDKKIKQSLLIERNTLTDMFQDSKCSDESERKLCGLINIDGTGTYGVRKIADNYLIYVDATNFIDEARTILVEGEEKEIERLAAIFYLHSTFSKPEIYPLVSAHNLIFVFYYNHEMKFAMGIDSAYLKELNDQIKESHFSIARRIGMSIFRYSNDYISLY